MAWINELQKGAHTCTQSVHMNQELFSLLFIFVFLEAKFLSIQYAVMIYASLIRVDSFLSIREKIRKSRSNVMISFLFLQWFPLFTTVFS